MKRLLQFALVVIPIILLAALVIDFWGYTLDFFSYFYGLGVAAIITFILNTFDDWRSTAERPNQRQSVKIETKETPNEIISAASEANRNLILATIILLIILLGLLIY